jgi:hypothetical protein
MIDLDQVPWEDLFTDVLTLAVRGAMPRRSQDADDEEHRHSRATQRDRAREATQRAFERFFRVMPILDTIDELRRYLEGAMRSELNHSYRETHKAYEEEAVVEHVVLTGGVSPSAEVAILEEAEERRAEAREDRKLARRKELLREELRGDRVALGAIECLEKGIDDPAEQARILRCSVPDIHNARKRRSRAVQRILDAEGDEDEDSEE